MNLKVLSFLVSVFIFSSCNDAMKNDLGNYSRENIIKKTPVTPEKKDKPVSEEESEGRKFGSYSTLLSNYVPIDSTVFIGENTVQLQDVGLLDRLTEISPETLNDFIEKNKIPEKLTKRFDVYANLEIIKIESSIATTLNFVKEKYPESKGVILLSRVGENRDNSQSLIYMEHYDLLNNLTRKFCLIWRENNKVKKVEWVALK
jgi:hypothetical protein